MGPMLRSSGVFLLPYVCRRCCGRTAETLRCGAVLLMCAGDVVIGLLRYLGGVLCFLCVKMVCAGHEVFVLDC